MGFGRKTSWIAVASRTAVEVADALGLDSCQDTGWDDGISMSYAAGVFVAGPVDGWTLAHSSLDLPVGSDAASPHFLEWLCGLSKTLGTVQYFGSVRISSYYAWVWARDGEFVRGYAVGEGETYLDTGKPTNAEYGITEIPSEDDVLTLAGQWSVNPETLDGPPGIYGLAQTAHLPDKIAIARAYIANFRRGRGL